VNSDGFFDGFSYPYTTIGALDMLYGQKGMTTWAIPVRAVL
jgi:hypothetical protein